MKFGRLLVVSWVAASVPCAVACGSASSNGLFSAPGGSSNVSKAGADGAGASAAGDAIGGATASAGANSGVGGHEQGAAGKGAAGSPAESGGAGPATTGGGSGDKGQAGAPPSGGSAGAPSGGSAGDSAGGTSTGGAGAGGASAGTGGSGGTAGGGSAGAPGSGCPDNAPVQAASCQTTTPDSCFYAGVACSCLQTGQNAFQRRWACYGTPDKCPDSAPNAGTGPCKGGAECPYPDAFCVCAGNGGGNNDKYICQSAGVPQCPTFKPLNVAQCSTVRSCAYADDQCFCNGSNWDCESTN
jgi:hypothetical protein